MRCEHPSLRGTPRQRRCGYPPTRDRAWRSRRRPGAADLGWAVRGHGRCPVAGGHRYAAADDIPVQLQPARGRRWPGRRGADHRPGRRHLLCHRRGPRPAPTRSTPGPATRSTWPRSPARRSESPGSYSRIPPPPSGHPGRGVATTKPPLTWPTRYANCSSVNTRVATASSPGRSPTAVRPGRARRPVAVAQHSRGCRRRGLSDVARTQLHLHHVFGQADDPPCGA